MTNRPDPPSADAAAAESAGATPQVPATGRYARLVAAGILFSRIAGLVRERVFAHYFGTSLYASAFRAALRMPNVLQNLLGEGTLSASFIPVYAGLIERGETEKAGRLAGAIFALLLAIAGALSLIGILLAPLLVSIFFPGWTGEQRDITVACTRIIFPMTGILVLYAWSLGILNSHRRFFTSYFAPVLWNAAMVAAMIVFGTRGWEGRPLTLALAWGALVGGALQFLIQVPWVLRLEKNLRIRPNLRAHGVRTVLLNTGPAVLGRGVVQISGWVDLVLASFLFTGAVAALGYAQTIYLLPYSLFGMSVAAAELPEMARGGTSGQEALQRRVNAGLRRIALLVVPSAIGFFTLGDVIVAALYQTGDFVRADTVLVHLVLAGYTLGLIASTSTRLYISAFYAEGDTRTPALIALLRVVLAASLGFALMVHLEWVEIGGRPLGAVGLATGAGVAAWVEWWYLRRYLRRRIGYVGSGFGSMLRMLAASLAGAAAGRGLVLLLPPFAFRFGFIAEAALAIPVFAIVYFVVARALGVEEAGEMFDRVLRRLRR